MCVVFPTVRLVQSVEVTLGSRVTTGWNVDAVKEQEGNGRRRTQVGDTWPADPEPGTPKFSFFMFLYWVLRYHGRSGAKPPRPASPLVDLRCVGLVEAVKHRGHVHHRPF